MNRGTDRKRTGLKTGHYRSEAGLGESYSQSAVGNVVRRSDDAIVCQRDQTIDQALLGCKVNRWWSAGDNSADSLRIFARGKFLRARRRRKSRFLARHSGL